MDLTQYLPHDTFGSGFDCFGFFCICNVHYIRNDIVKEELIATKATCQAIIHVANLLLFGSIGINVFVYWKLLLGLAASVVIGTMVGKKILHRL